jgi:hypothetical protein
MPPPHPPRLAATRPLAPGPPGMRQARAVAGAGRGAYYPPTLSPPPAAVAAPRSSTPLAQPPANPRPPQGPPGWNQGLGPGPPQILPRWWQGGRDPGGHSQSWLLPAGPPPAPASLAGAGLRAGATCGGGCTPAGGSRSHLKKRWLTGCCTFCRCGTSWPQRGHSSFFRPSAERASSQSSGVSALMLRPTEPSPRSVPHLLHGPGSKLQGLRLHLHVQPA